MPEGTTPEQVLEFAQTQLGGSAAPQAPIFDPSQTSGPPAQKPWRGSVLPWSQDIEGNSYFDPDTGVVGAVKRTIMGPGEALEGKFQADSPEGQRRAAEAAAVMTPVSPALRAGVGWAGAPMGGYASSFARTAAPKYKVPTAGELKSAATSGYKQAGDAGVDYTSASVKQWADDVQRTLEAEGRIAELNPQTFALLKKLQDPPPDSVASLRALDAFRKRLNDVAGDKSPGVSAAANIVIRKLDEFLEGVDPVSVVPRPHLRGEAPLPVTQDRFGAIGGRTSEAQAAAEAAADALKAARGNSAAAFRSNRITGLEEAAESRAAAAHSGLNLGNTIRQRLASLLQNDKLTRGLSPKELAAIQQVVDGTASTNTLRYVSNLLGGGGGIGQTLVGAGGIGGGAYALGGPAAGIAGAAIPLTGAATRLGYNALVRRQLGNVDKLVRSRSPLAQERRAAAPAGHSTAPDMRAALTRALFLQMMQQNQGLMGGYEEPGLMAPGIRR